MYLHYSIDDADLTPQQFRLLSHVVRRGMTEGFCWERQKKMAEHLQWSVRTVQRHMKALLEKGFLVKISEPGLSAIYTWGKRADEFLPKSKKSEKKSHNEKAEALLAQQREQKRREALIIHKSIREQEREERERHIGSHTAKKIELARWKARQDKNNTLGGETEESKISTWVAHLSKNPTTLEAWNLLLVEEMSQKLRNCFASRHRGNYSVWENYRNLYPLTWEELRSQLELENDDNSLLQWALLGETDTDTDSASAFDAATEQIEQKEIEHDLSVPSTSIRVADMRVTVQELVDVQEQEQQNIPTVDTDEEVQETHVGTTSIPEKKELFDIPFLCVNQLEQYHHTDEFPEKVCLIGATHPNEKVTHTINKHPCMQDGQCLRTVEIDGKLYDPWGNEVPCLEELTDEELKERMLRPTLHPDATPYPFQWSDSIAARIPQKIILYSDSQARQYRDWLIPEDPQVLEFEKRLRKQEDIVKSLFAKLKQRVD